MVDSGWSSVGDERRTSDGYLFDADSCEKEACYNHHG
jgi:hypothetical protein